ncbi:alpha/beta hydrolase [Pseudidiomarina salinarum]|uniref:alpha/beta hydrolase n=1 Tax=Pseudidiomarina salinarum TaxID=435908 RepID=UPI000A060296|nr:alpha/beta hydrolase [Pseudidiomarina salinarum]RUO70966.1 alpha/beta hydrolase [Pseudidiomarina salinarum]
MKPIAMPLTRLFTGSLLLLLASSAVAEPQNARLTQLEGCYLDGIEERVQCGSLQVPENYDQPEGRTIAINFAVLPAISESKAADPLLILAGGPGQAATELAPMIDRIFKDVRRQRDILLIDQRGTGKSNPLSCELNHVEELVKADDDVELAQMASDCASKYTQVDLTQYHTVNAIRDFEAVRAALGYPQVNLYGGSYGSRAGLVYMREAPASVRSAILDAVAPPQVVVGPFGQHGADSFEILLANCAAQQSCDQTFPALEQTYLETVARLEQEPVALTVPDPLSNQPIEILITAGRFTSVMRVGLYHPSTRKMLPFVIQQTAAENYTPLIGLLGSTLAQSQMYMGLTLSVLCSEDLPRATPELLEADAANNFIGGRTGEAFVEMCSVWPQAERPDSWFDPVVSEIPALLLSGASDPVTPPAWGELAAATLSNSRHLIANHGAHTIAGHTCANKLAATFIDTLNFSTLDATCLQREQPAPFILNSNGKGL